MCAPLVDGLDSLGGENQSDGFLELRHINALFLEIWVLPNHPCRVELGSTGPVGVSASDLGPLFHYWAYFCHSCDILAEWNLFFK